MCTVSTSLPPPSRPLRLEAGRINVIACMKLLTLWLLISPKAHGEGVPYPHKQRRGPYANYWEAYRANDGWTGQELMELIAHYMGTQWQPNKWTMYNAVLGGPDGLATRGWLVARQANADQNMTKAWYRIKDQPEGDPSRPVYRAFEQDKENLAAHLKDAARFLARIDLLIYGGRLGIATQTLTGR